MTTPTSSTAPVSDYPTVILPPDATALLQRRSRRAGELAQSTAGLAPFLNFIGHLSQQQARLAAGYRPATEDAWQRLLTELTESIAGQSPALAAAANRISQIAPTLLTAKAQTLLSGDLASMDPAETPLLAAALQIHWLTVAASANPTHTSINADRCPVCAFPPVAAVLQTGGSVQGLRYLACPLCSTLWHRVRSQCVECGSSGKLGYFAIESTSGPAQAEACDDCRIYLKILNREKAPDLDPIADDLASLPLDILMAESGYSRVGFNPFLIPGS